MVFHVKFVESKKTMPVGKAINGFPIQLGCNNVNVTLIYSTEEAIDQWNRIGFN